MQENTPKHSEDSNTPAQTTPPNSAQDSPQQSPEIEKKPAKRPRGRPKGSKSRPKIGYTKKALDKKKWPIGLNGKRYDPKLHEEATQILERTAGKENTLLKRSIRMKQLLASSVSDEEIMLIMKRAVEQAIEGDNDARNFVFNRVVGKETSATDNDDKVPATGWTIVINGVTQVDATKNVENTAGQDNQAGQETKTNKPTETPNFPINIVTPPAKDVIQAEFEDKSNS